MKYDSRKDTRKHIRRVGELLSDMKKDREVIGALLKDIAMQEK